MKSIWIVDGAIAALLLLLVVSVWSFGPKAEPCPEYFSQLMPRVLSYEGVGPGNPTGYADIPGDRGGITNWGVSQRAWAAIQADGVLVKFPNHVKKLTKAQALAVYRLVYYHPQFDSLSIAAALVAFDAEVNQNNAQRLLARVSSADTTEDLLWLRLEHYARISRNSAQNREFLVNYWIPRLLTVRRDAQALRGCHA